MYVPRFVCVYGGVFKGFRRVQLALAYVVFVCSGCGRFLVAKAGQKSKRCNYCESVVDLWRAKRVAGAASAREASTIVREFKMREGK
jgi:LSD1 subclass zinc finger protein